MRWLLTAIVPVLTTCAALNRVFWGFSFVADRAFAYSRHVAGRYGQSIIDELEVPVTAFQEVGHDISVSHITRALNYYNVIVTLNLLSIENLPSFHLPQLFGFKFADL